MTVIFDLDYTLLDTARFKNNLGKSLEKFGISSEEFWSAYEAATKENSRIRDFGLKKILEPLKNTLTCRIEEAQSCLTAVVKDTDKYLFPDASWLLETLKADGCTLKLFTHGNLELQKMKIEGMCIKSFFDDIVITTGYKEENMGAFEGDMDSVVIVNDNGEEIMAMKKKWPEMHMIGILGPKGLPDDSNIRIAKSLKEVYSIIQELRLR